MKPVASRLASLFAMAALTSASPPAHAVDGCKVLLCIAGNWKNISECHSEVRQALHDVARGKGWPECKTGSGDDSQPLPATGSRQYSTANNCYEFFKVWVWVELEAGGYWDWYCAWPGYVDTYIEGRHWLRMFYDPWGYGTIEEWDTAAREAFPVELGNQRIGVDLYWDAWIVAGSPYGPPPPPPPKPPPPDTGGGT